MKVMLVEKARYLENCGVSAGTAKGFREWIADAAAHDPRVFPIDALRDEAADKAWQRQPRKRGPDLFSVAGINVAEFLTRRRKGYTESDVEEGDEEGLFEKIDSRFATVDDYLEDALIKMRNAARASAAAEEQMKHGDEILRLARGDRSARLMSLADLTP